MFLTVSTTLAAAGATTGAVGAAVFNPIDVVRIRMQGPTPYASTVGAFGAIAAAEGVREGEHTGVGFRI